MRQIVQNDQRDRISISEKGVGFTITGPQKVLKDKRDWDRDEERDREREEKFFSLLAYNCLDF